MAPFSRKKKRQHRYAAHSIGVPVLAETIKQLNIRAAAWQEKVLAFSGIVPEVMTGYVFVFNVMDRISFEIQKYDRLTDDWKHADTEALQGIERRLNKAFKAGRAAGLDHLVAESWIIAGRRQGRMYFETLSPQEIQQKSGKVQKRVIVDGKPTWRDVRPDDTVIRVYTPSPADRSIAAGPHQALLGLLETMAVELLRDQADATTVLAGNGIMLIPDEVCPEESDTVDDSETPGSRRSFESRLEDAMVSTISNRTLGEAVVPIILYGPAEYLKEVRHIIPKRETAGESSARMDSYIERYARDIDLPKQAILGVGDANHWADWKVDENTWAYHLEPKADRIAAALYEGFVAAIIENLDLDPADYRLAPNAAAAIAKQDHSKTAYEAYRLGTITADSYIEAIGMDASDIKDDANENLYILSGAVQVDQGAVVDASAPDRTAAARPTTILSMASKAANSQQKSLEKTYRRILNAIAADAAKAGRRSAKDQAASKSEATAAGEIPFLGYEPGAYFAAYAEELALATVTELSKYLRRISTLTNIDYRSLQDVWRNEFTHRANVIEIEARKLASSIESSSFKSGKPARVPDNVVRTLTSLANGGTNQPDESAGNLSRPTHSGQDPMMVDALDEAVGGGFVTRYEWTVGSPQNPYEPHQDLAGATWFSWQEFDVLDVPPGDQVVDGTVYFPGDHAGCQCDYQLEFVPASEAG